MYQLLRFKKLNYQGLIFIALDYIEKKEKQKTDSITRYNHLK